MKKSKLYGLDVRPLGTEAPVKKSTRAKLKIVKTSDDSACASPLNLVESLSTSVTPADSQASIGSQSVLMDEPKDAHMTTLTLKGLNKKGTAAFYGGARGVIRIPVIAFVDKTAPETFQTEDVFAPARTPKVKLSKEARKALAAQRKAERANAPKPTAAERIAKAEARFNKLKAKLANEAAM